MVLKIFLLSLGSGLSVALFLATTSAAPMSVLAGLFLVAQAAILATVTPLLADRSRLRRLFRNRKDADYVADPQRIVSGTAKPKRNLGCLLVDDDSIALDIMEDMLGTLGYTHIVTASSGADALDKIAAAATPFDCCFLDIEMPDMDGVTLCGKIRSMAGYERTPLIMVTAKRGREHVRSAFKVGATDYMTKPVQLPEIESRLSAIEVGAQRKELPGLDSRLVPLSSMENYLLQLERGGMFAATVLTFKLNGHETVLSDQSFKDPKDLLLDASRCILSAVECEDALLSYAGDGVFAAIFNSRSVDETKIDAALGRAERKHSGVTSPLYFRTISMGSQVPMNWEGEDGESVTLLRNAIRTTDAGQQIFVA